MHYRDLLQIPTIDWKPWADRFEPTPESAAQIEARKQRSDTGKRHALGAGRPRAIPVPLNQLAHRIANCTGRWNKQTRNKQGHYIVMCNKCGAKRVSDL